MSDSRPISISALARGLGSDFRRTWTSLVAFDAAFKLAAAFVLIPGSAWLLARVIGMTGHSAVSNADILRFLFSLTGMLTAGLIGIGLLGVLLLEHTGMLAVAALQLAGRRVTPRRALSATMFGAIRVLRLGLAQLGALLLVFSPFAALVVLTYLAFLSRHDINYYLSDKPPAYFAALGVVGLALIVGALIGVRLFVGWSLALPILLFEQLPPTASLRTSRQRVRGAGWRIGAALIGWHVLAITFGAVLLWAFQQLAATLLDRAGDRAAVIVPLTAGLLAIHGLITAGASFLSAAGHCLLTLRIYHERGGAADRGIAESDLTAPAPWKRQIFGLGVAGLIAASLILCITLPRQFDQTEQIEITGHRGCEVVAPENTLSSFQAAIDAGVDWIELDVQLSRDGAIIVLHDRDFLRVCGVAKRPDELTLAEIKQLDASMSVRFGAKFAGERIATLKEVFDLVRGKVKVNIELKVYGGDRRIAAAVADFVYRETLGRECLVASLDYRALLEAKKRNPALTTAAIVSVAVGDIGRLDVNVLSVSKSLATDEFLKEARRLNKGVLVWTVNDAGQMVDFIEHGAGKIITNEPSKLAQIRRDRAGLSAADRMLLAARFWLGIQPRIEVHPHDDARP